MGSQGSTEHFSFASVLSMLYASEAAKAYLFLNYEQRGRLGYQKISEGLIFGKIMHGIYPENVGVSILDYLKIGIDFDYLNHSAIFTAERGQTYYFYPIQARDYLATPEIKHLPFNGDEVLIHPQEEDFNSS